MTLHEFYLADEAATEDLGRALAQAVHESLVIHLHGELGAGKTTLVRGMLRAWGWSGKVKSPTYGLVEPYELGSRRIHHFDLYRLTDPHELDYIGIRDMVGDGVLLVEWPERGGDVVPAADLECRLAYAQSGRTARLQAHTAVGESCLREAEST